MGLGTLIGAISYRGARIVRHAAARLFAWGDWKREWSFTPAEYRGALARRLVRERTLVGLSKADLFDALGAPDRFYSPPSTWSCSWYVGQRQSAARLMFPYDEHLVITTDTTEHVVSAEVMNLDR